MTTMAMFTPNQNLFHCRSYSNAQANIHINPSTLILKSLRSQMGFGFEKTWTYDVTTE